MKLRVEELVAASGAELLVGDPLTLVEGFANDSRTAAVGSCFVALRSERDGHAFLRDACDHRVAAVLIDAAALPTVNIAAVDPRGSTAVLVVPDTLTAMGHIAAYARRSYLDGAVVVGITGSTGKTSTKDLVVGAVQNSRRVHANVASFNNEIGLPTTVLSASPDTEVLVLEMGARFAGNISDLCEIASPSIGVITNIGMAHAEHLGGPEGIAAVKGELFAALPKNGTAICGEGPFAQALAHRAKCDVLTVSETTWDSAEVFVEVLGIDAGLRPTIRIASPWGTATGVVALRGAHQAVNAAMAVCVAALGGCAFDDAVAGLADASAAQWRMELLTTATGYTIINDAYNANPTSMAAAIHALAAASTTGRRVAVLGAMRELGERSEPEHRRIGGLLQDAKIDAAICVGVEGQWIANSAAGLTTVLCVETAVEAQRILQEFAEPGDVVLIKASRAVGLEALAGAFGETLAVEVT